MPAASQRFQRQMRLAEIGQRGQACIESAVLRLGPHLDPLAQRVARSYALGAGIGGEREDPSLVAPPALSAFRHPTSRSVAAGALAALSTIVEALAS